MECTFALVADAANHEAGGKLNLLGVFDRITPATFPYQHPQMFVIVNLTAGPAEFGKKKDFEVSLLDPDGRALLKLAASGTVPTPDAQSGGNKASVQLVLQLVNIPFPVPGPYAVAVLVGGDQKASIPLEAVALSGPKKRGKRRGS